MRERAELILKILCGVLLAAFVVQLAGASRRMNPLRGVVIPALPTLASDTNSAPASGTNMMASAGKGTNRPVGGTNVVASGTNIVALKAAGTNAASKMVPHGMTNEVVAAAPVLSSSGMEKGNDGAVATNGVGTSNSVAAIEPVNVITNSTAGATNQSATNVIAQTEADTNATPMNPSLTDTTHVTAATEPAIGTSNFSLPSMPTNARAMTLTARTNIRVSGTNAGTNAALLASLQKRGTNSPMPPQMAMAGMNMVPAGMRGGGPAPELAPEVKARVLRVYESELLGQVIRPQPMALLGIAGHTAFLRSPSGQTGLVKEGDSLGEIKLVRIGINRVLVEQDGQKKELTIFEGYGSKSLLEEQK